MARRRRRKVEGAAETKSMIRALPDAARQEMAEVLEDGSRDIQAAILPRTPRRSGTLHEAIKRRVLKQTLQARIGVVGPPNERRRVFYARILDLGRRGQVVKAVRRAPTGKISRYLMRVRAITAKRFITGRYTDVRTAMNDRLRGVWDRILRRASEK